MPPRATHGCNIDGFAKMPLQASIFASWYNGHGITLIGNCKFTYRVREFSAAR